MRASLVALSLAACGDGLAASADAAIDGALDLRGLVSIEYRGDVDPIDVAVFCQTVDSRLVLSTRLDVTGRATCRMESGGFVTLAFPDRQLLTYTEVQVGDVLAFEHFSSADPAVTPITIKVPAESGATSYRLYSPCGAREIIGAQLQPISISLGVCDSVADILVSAITPTRERFAFRGDVLLSAPIVVETPYQPEVVGSILVTGSPPSSVLASQSLVRGTDDLIPRRMTAIAQGWGTGLLTMPRPPSATQLTHLEATSSDLHVIEWEPSTNQLTIAWPDVPIREYTMRPEMHEEAPLVIWEESETGLVADGVYLELQWDDQDLVPHRWSVLAPRTAATALELPTLPYPALVPIALTTHITRFDNFVIDGGFAAARGVFRLGRLRHSATWFIEGERGRVIYQALD